MSLFALIIHRQNSHLIYVLYLSLNTTIKSSTAKTSQCELIPQVISRCSRCVFESSSCYTPLCPVPAAQLPHITSLLTFAGGLSARVQPLQLRRDSSPNSERPRETATLSNRTLRSLNETSNLRSAPADSQQSRLVNHLQLQRYTSHRFHFVGSSRDEPAAVYSNRS